MPVLVAMTDADFASFRAAAVTGYAAEKVAAGQWSPEQSLELSEKNFDELLPEAINTVDHHLYCVVDDQG